MSNTFTQEELLRELEPVVEENLEPAPDGRQGVDPARVRAVERGPQLRRPARRRAVDAERVRRCPTSRAPR